MRTGQRAPFDTLDFNVMSPQDWTLQTIRSAGAKTGNWFDWPSVEGDRNISGYGRSASRRGRRVCGSAVTVRHLCWADALQPAIEHAERGLEVDWFASLSLAVEAAALGQVSGDCGDLPRQWPGTSGRRTRGGALSPMTHGKAKARLLRRLARPARATSTRAKRRIWWSKDLSGGRVAHRGRADLAAYRPQWRDPLVAGNYRDVRDQRDSGSERRSRAFLMLQRVSSAWDCRVEPRRPMRRCLCDGYPGDIREVA